MANVTIPQIAGVATAVNTADLLEISQGGVSMQATAGLVRGFTLLEAHTASNSATLDFTSFLSSLYDTYLFMAVGLIPVNSGDDLWMRMGTGAGPSWDAGNNYNWSFVYVHSAASAPAVVVGASDPKIRIGVGATTSGGECQDASIILKSPQSASLFKNVSYSNDASNSGNFYSANGSGSYLSATAITGVRFLNSTGNMSSGVIRCYGIVKS